MDLVHCEEENTKFLAWTLDLLLVDVVWIRELAAVLLLVVFWPLIFIIGPYIYFQKWSPVENVLQSTPGWSNIFGYDNYLKYFQLR